MDFAYDAVTVLIAGMFDRIEFGQSAPYVRQHCPTATGEPNPSVSAFEQRNTELILKSSDAAADGGGIDAERAGSPGKIPSGRRRLHIYQVTNLHGRHALYDSACECGARRTRI